MRLNTSALHEVLFTVSGVVFFVDKGWDPSGMGQMNISPMERLFLRELDFEPLWLLVDVELDAKERGGEMLGMRELLAEVADEVRFLAAEEMLIVLPDGR
jgi:hypothetical protein